MERPRETEIKQMKARKEIVRAEKKIAKDVTKIEEKVTEHKIDQKEADREINEDVKEAVGNEIKKQKVEKTENKIKKTEACVNANDVSISTKQAIAICDYIRDKNIDRAIFDLEQVLTFKKAVPMRGEIPHRRGKIMSGRYPMKSSKEFIRLLKSLKSNAIVNELELEKYVIFCKANMASRPFKRFGQGRTKRTHITLKLINKKK